MATRSLGQLTIDIVAKIAGFEQGMDRAARAADKRSKDIERSLKRVSAIGGAAISGALVAGVTAFIKNTMEAERSLAQLDAILKSTGNAAGYSREQLVGMANELQKVSTFASNEIVDAQTRLLSYSGVVGENIPRAMQAIIDQSARLGMSLSQSAETIGRALESPAKAAAALAQQGFGAAFTKEVRATIDALVAAGREADAQILILEILEESYGGAAQAARDTLGGALQSLKHTINDVMTGGEGDLDGLTQAVNDLNEALSDPGFRKATSEIAQAFIDLATDAARSIDPLIREIKGVGNALEGLAGQAMATATIVGGAFKLSSDQIRSGIAEYSRATDQLEQGIRDSLGGHVPNQFWNVRSGVSSTMDRGRTVDTSGLDISGNGKKKGLSDEEKAAKKLQDAYESLMGSMHQRIELFGKEGEAARVRYEIEHGSLKGLSDALAEQAIARAEQIDSMERMAKLQEAAAKAAEDETRRIADGLEAGKQLLADLQFELELMRMTNAERATAIQLRGLEAEAVKEYGDAIAEANRRIEEEMATVELMDGARREFSNFIEDVFSGTKSIGDAFRDMLDNINRMIMQRIADNWVEQLFGGMGTNQGGSAGGNWFSTIMGMFAGGRATGGWIGAGHFAEVNERGLEMATVRGRDYLLTGGSPVEITPNNRLGMGRSVNVTQQFINPVMADRRSETQRASESARRIREAQRNA